VKTCGLGIDRDEWLLPEPADQAIEIVLTLNQADLTRLTERVRSEVHPESLSGLAISRNNQSGFPTCSSPAAISSNALDSAL
jgi:hypothetical protein